MERRSWLDSPWLRVLALLLAIGLAYLSWRQWGDTIQQHHAALTGDESASADPALQECLTVRVGAVEQMKAQGVIDEAQYETFKTRAERLCELRRGQ